MHKSEQWRSELLAAGWTEKRHDLWISPEGELFRGPFAAWAVMKKRKEASGDE